MNTERIINPLIDYGINEVARLVVHNNQSKLFSLIKEIPQGALHIIQYADLDSHLDYTL